MAHADYAQFTATNNLALLTCPTIEGIVRDGNPLEVAVSAAWTQQAPNPAFQGHLPGGFDNLIDQIANSQGNQAGLNVVFESFFGLPAQWFANHATNAVVQTFAQQAIQESVTGEARYFKFMRENNDLLDQVPDLRIVLTTPAVKAALIADWGTNPPGHAIPNNAAMIGLITRLINSNGHLQTAAEFVTVFGAGQANAFQNAVGAIFPAANSDNKLRGEIRYRDFISKPELADLPKLETLVKDAGVKTKLIEGWGDAANPPPTFPVLRNALSILPIPAAATAKYSDIKTALNIPLGVKMKAELNAAGINNNTDLDVYRGEARYHEFLVAEQARFAAIPALEAILKLPAVKDVLGAHYGSIDPLTNALRPFPTAAQLNTLSDQLALSPDTTTAKAAIETAFGGSVAGLSAALNTAGVLDANVAKDLFATTQYNQLASNLQPLLLRNTITNHQAAVIAQLKTFDSARTVKDLFTTLSTANKADYATQLGKLGIAVQPPAGGGGLTPVEIDNLYTDIQYQRIFDAHSNLQTLLTANQANVKALIANKTPAELDRIIVSINKAAPTDQLAKLAALGILTGPAVGGALQAPNTIFFAENEFERICKANPTLEPLLKANRGAVGQGGVVDALAQLGNSKAIDNVMEAINQSDKTGLLVLLQNIGINNKVPAPGGPIDQAAANEFFAEREFKRIYDANPFLQSYLNTHRVAVINNLKAPYVAGAAVPNHGGPVTVESRQHVDKLIEDIKNADVRDTSMQIAARALGIDLNPGPAPVAASWQHALYDEIYARKEYEKLYHKVPSNVQAWMQNRKDAIILQLKGNAAVVGHDKNKVEKLRKQLLENSSSFDYQNRNHIADALEQLGIIDTGANNALTKKPFEKTHFDNAEHPYTRELFKQNQQSFSHVDDRPATYTYLLKHYRAVSVAAMNNQSAKEERTEIERKLVTLEEQLTRHRLILEAKLAKTGLSSSAYATLQKKLQMTLDDLHSIKITRENFANVPAELTKIAYSGVKAEVIPIAAGTTMAAAANLKVQEYLNTNAVAQHIGTLASGGTTNTTDTFSDSMSARVVQTEIKENTQVKKFVSVTGVENGVYQAQIYSDPTQLSLADKDGLPHPQYLYWAHQEVENYMSGNPDPDSPVKLSGQFTESQVKALYLEFALKGVEVINQVTDYKPKVSEVLALQNMQLKNVNLHFFTNDEAKALAISKGAIQKTEESLGISPETPKRPGSNH